MDALFHLRDMIASLDAPLVDALCQRAVRRRNEALYARDRFPAPGLRDLAGAYATSRTLPGRVRLLRSSYVQILLPQLCVTGPDDEVACLAADTACLNALARRLSLSIHVATRKRESLPAALQAAIRSRDPLRVEEAVTNSAVEAEVLARVKRQSRKTGPSPGLPDHIVAIYADWLIPLSRKIQVHGLLADCPEEAGGAG